MKVYANSTTNIYKAFYLEDRDWNCNYRRGEWTHHVFSSTATTLEKAYLHQITIEERTVDCPMCAGRGVRHWIIKGCSGPRDDPCSINIGCQLCDRSGVISKELYAAFLLIAPEHYKQGFVGSWHDASKNYPSNGWIPDAPKVITARTGEQLCSEGIMLLGIQALARRLGKRLRS